MITKSLLQKLVEEQLAGTDRFVVDILVKPGNRIFVFIDSDTYVRIEHCITLSKHIESNLNRDEEDFELNVSSSGLDHPYTLLRQYIKNIGRQVKVKLQDGGEITGELTAANEHEIEVQEQKKVKKEIITTLHKIAFPDIKETKEIIKF